MPPKILVLYHGNCADGFTAAWVAHKKFGAQAEYLAVQHNSPPPDVKGRDVCILDFSWKWPEMLNMIGQADSLLVLDHHETAQKELAGLDEITLGYAAKARIIFDMKKSGAMLAWEYFFPGHEVPRLVRHVQDRDLWTWNEPDSKQINAAIGTYTKDWSTWDHLAEMLTKFYGRNRLFFEGCGILRMQESMIKSALDHAWEETIAGYRVKVVNVAEKTLISEITEKLAEGRPFGASFFMGADGRRTFSLRSMEGGINVGELAASLGGGGHAQASGFKEEKKTPMSEQRACELAGAAWCGEKVRREDEKQGHGCRTGNGIRPHPPTRVQPWKPDPIRPC